MKKILNTFAILATILAFTGTVSAANFGLSSAASTTVGKTFTVTVRIDPQGSTIYTAKAQVKFSPDILEVRGFTFAPTWFPLSQPGYDSTNNAGGELIKTAGYSSGLSAPATFGTITFYAKKVGDATISMGSGSLLLNADNGNTSTGGNTLTVKVADAPKTTPKPVASSEPVSAAPEASASAETLQEASIGTSSGQFATSVLPMVLVGMATFAGGFFAGRRTLAKRGQ